MRHPQIYVSGKKPMMGTLFTEPVGRYIHVENRADPLCEVQVKGKGKDPTHLIACDHVAHHDPMTCVAEGSDSTTP